MEEKKHRKPRPEMGTPEYEEWRKRMLQRRRERLKRERRKRLIAIGVAAVLIRWSVGRRNCFKQQVCFRIRQESGNF